MLTPDETVAAAETKLEGSIYGLRKFMKLAADCNPNILDVLFCRDAEVRVCTPIGQRLRAERGRFLSQKCKHTFSGYAMSQLRRIKGHRAWLLSPPKAAPTRAEFDLPERTLIPADQRDAAMSLVKRKLEEWQLDLDGLDKASKIELNGRIEEVLVELQIATDEARFKVAARSVGLDGNFIALLDRERRYRSAATYWKQYQRWKTNRNPARAELEEKYGYDAMHAGHLVRLLRMGREILTTGEVHIWRGDLDAEEIVAIRNGAWSYDELIAWAEEQDAALTEIYDGRGSPLPKSPDRTGLDQLCSELVEASGVL
ncbi:MAG: hypothetical protein GY898_04400 [Proteobacteria bacterium]|nr:hypothetical protein [Pseudomonadota bacterium]